MSSNYSFAQVWSLADTQEYLSAGPYPVDGTHHEKADWRKQYNIKCSRLEKAIGHYLVDKIKQGQAYVPSFLDRITTPFTYSLRQALSDPRDDSSIKTVGSLILRHLDYMGIIKEGLTDEEIHARIVQSIDQGNYPRLSSDPQICQTTGMFVVYGFNGWNLILSQASVKQDPTSITGIKRVFQELTEENVPEVGTQVCQIPVPSGELLISDWFGLPQFYELSKPIDDSFNDEINSVAGRMLITKKYAHDLGVAYVFGSRASVVQSARGVGFGYLPQDEDGERIEPKGMVGSVCGSLRWTTVVDRQHLINLLSRSMDRNEAQDMLQRFLAENREVLTVHVHPGHHHVYFSGHSKEFDKTFSSQFQTQGLELGNFEEPVFFISSSELAPAVQPGPVSKTDQDSKLHDVVRVLLRHEKLLEEAVVCGPANADPSAANKLEIAFVIPKDYELRDLDKYRKLLSGGAYGTPRHGKFSMFLVFDDCVWKTTDDCLGFTRSQNPQACLRALISSSQPWPTWQETAFVAPPAPSKPIAKI